MRRAAWVWCTAVTTPSRDPYALLAAMLPMVTFYDAAIIVIGLMRK